MFPTDCISKIESLESTPPPPGFITLSRLNKLVRQNNSVISAQLLPYDSPNLTSASFLDRKRTLKTDENKTVRKGFTSLDVEQGSAIDRLRAKREENRPALFERKRKSNIGFPKVLSTVMNNQSSLKDSKQEPGDFQNREESAEDYIHVREG